MHLGGFFGLFFWNAPLSRKELEVKLEVLIMFNRLSLRWMTDSKFIFTSLIKSSQHSIFFSISFSVVKIKYTYLISFVASLSVGWIVLKRFRKIDVFQPKYYGICLNGKWEFHLFQFQKLYFFLKKPTINVLALMSLQTSESWKSAIFKILKKH